MLLVPRLDVKFATKLTLHSVLVAILCIFYHLINAITVIIILMDAYNAHPAQHAHSARQDTLQILHINANYVRHP